MSTSTPEPPPIQPPPSFDDFKFNVIGQPPQLLKRLATPPLDFRRPHTPGPMDLQYPTHSENPTWDPESSAQPSLQRRLENATYATNSGSFSEDLYLPMDSADDLLEQKSIIREPHPDSPSFPNVSPQSTHRPPPSLSSPSSVETAAAQHSALPTPSSSSPPPFQTSSLLLPTQDVFRTDNDSTKENRQLQADLGLAYDCALVAFEKAERQLKSARDAFETAKATLTAITMAQSHFHPALLSNIPHYHSRDNEVQGARSSGSLLKDRGMAGIARPDMDGTGSDILRGKEGHSMSELEREADEARLAWGGVSEHSATSKTRNDGSTETSFLHQDSTGTIPSARQVPLATIERDTRPTSEAGTSRSRDHLSTNIPVNKPTQSSTVSPLSASHEPAQQTSLSLHQQPYDTHEGPTSSVESGRKGRYALKPTALASSLHRTPTGVLAAVTSDAEEEQMVADEIQPNGGSDAISVDENLVNEVEEEAEGSDRGSGAEDVETQRERSSNCNHATGPTRHTPPAQPLETSPGDMTNDRRSSLGNTLPFDGRTKGGRSSRVSSASYAPPSGQTTTSNPPILAAQIASPSEVTSTKLPSPAKPSPRDSVPRGEKVLPRASAKTRQATTSGSYRGSHKTPAASSVHDGTDGNLATGSSGSLLQRLESGPSVSTPTNPHVTPKTVPKPPLSLSTSTPTSVLGKRAASNAPSTPTSPRVGPPSKRKRKISATPDNESPSLESRIETGEGSTQRNDDMDEPRYITRSGQKPWRGTSKSRFPPHAPSLERSQTPPSRPRAARQEIVDSDRYYKSSQRGGAPRHHAESYHPELDRPLTNTHKPVVWRGEVVSGQAPAYYDRPPGRGRGGPRLGPHRLASNGPSRSDAHGPGASDRRGSEQPKLYDRINV